MFIILLTLYLLTLVICPLTIFSVSHHHHNGVSDILLHKDHTEKLSSAIFFTIIFLAIFQLFKQFVFSVLLLNTTFYIRLNQFLFFKPPDCLIWLKKLFHSPPKYIF